VTLLPSSINWHRQKLGSKQATMWHTPRVRGLAASASVWLRALNRRSVPHQWTPMDDFTLLTAVSIRAELNTLSSRPVCMHEDVDSTVDSLITDHGSLSRFVNTSPQWQQGGLSKDSRVEMYGHAPWQHMLQGCRHEACLHTTSATVGRTNSSDTTINVRIKLQQMGAGCRINVSSTFSEKTRN